MEAQIEDGKSEDDSVMEEKEGEDDDGEGGW